MNKTKIPKKPTEPRPPEAWVYARTRFDLDSENFASILSDLQNKYPGVEINLGDICFVNEGHYESAHYVAEHNVKIRNSNYKKEAAAYKEALKKYCADLTEYEKYQESQRKIKQCRELERAEKLLKAAGRL